MGGVIPSLIGWGGRERERERIRTCHHNPHGPPFPLPNSSSGFVLQGWNSQEGNSGNCCVRNSTMGSARRAFGRERSVHEILGGGIVADVLLWRRRDITMRILVGTLSALLIFEVSGYTLLSFVSNVLLLLLSILFLWAKAAAVLNRPLPPIPEMHLSEEAMSGASAFIRSSLNTALSALHNISQGKDAKLFYGVAGCLWVISFFGTLIHLLTLAYATLLVILTVPALYEKYEDWFDRYLHLAHEEFQMHEREYTACFTKYSNKISRWLIDKKKLL